VKSQPTPSIDDTLLAVAERQSDQWRVLLARRGDQPSVLDARTFSSDAAIAAWMGEQRCGDLRIVLPAHSTIVRSVTIPVASQGQMLAALRLQAEGMFLGSVPLVRIGLGVLEGASESERQGVIMAWPESQSGVTLNPKLEAMTRYVPEPAAMLVLASGDRPAISADRSVGSIAIAMRSPTKGSLEIRATRETAVSEIDGDGAWNEGLRRALVETALNAGMEPAQISGFVSDIEASTERSGDRVLMLDPDLAGLLGGKLDVRVSAASDGADWWREWAIPLAALVVACGPLSDLSKMRRLEERVAPSRVERFVERYSKPSRALLVSCVAVAIVGVAPIASAWLRMKTLEWKMPMEPSAFEAAQRKVDQRIALYGEISKRTLPMAKILGDLACCTPDGVEIALMGIGGFPEDHPLSLRWLGMHGAAFANWAVNGEFARRNDPSEPMVKLKDGCDLLLAFGVRFDDRVTGAFSEFAKGATIVHLDIDPSEHHKNKRANLAIHGT